MFAWGQLIWRSSRIQETVHSCSPTAPRGTCIPKTAACMEVLPWLGLDTLAYLYTSSAGNPSPEHLEDSTSMNKRPGETIYIYILYDDGIYISKIKQLQRRKTKWTGWRFFTRQIARFTWRSWPTLEIWSEKGMIWIDFPSFQKLQTNLKTGKQDPINKSLVGIWERQLQ